MRPLREPRYPPQTKWLSSVGSGDWAEFPKGQRMHKDAAAVRLALGPIFALVEDWRRSQPKIPSRNEAIRLLLRRALERPAEKLSDAAVVAGDDGAATGAVEAAR